MVALGSLVTCLLLWFYSLVLLMVCFTVAVSFFTSVGFPVITSIDRGLNLLSESLLTWLESLGFGSLNNLL